MEISLILTEQCNVYAKVVLYYKLNMFWNKMKFAEMNEDDYM